MTAAMARVRATCSNAGDHRETRRTPRSPWSRSSQAPQTICRTLRSAGRFRDITKPFCRRVPQTILTSRQNEHAWRGSTSSIMSLAFPKLLRRSVAGRAKANWCKRGCGCRCTLPRANQAYGSDCAAAAMGRLWRGRRDIPSAAFRQGRAHDF
jgi:hypothetical protein